MENQFTKTWTGTEQVLENGDIEVREFKFTTDDIGKFIVVKFQYEEHLFFGGSRLSINSNVLNTRNNDELYGVYEICYHSWCESEKNVSYKIYLKPIKSFKPWCPDRPWYTGDLENHINKDYNLFEENPVFDNVDEAIKFALKKNFELYPDTRFRWKKIYDKLVNKN